MSKPNLPELPSPLKEIAWLGGRPQDVYGRAEMIAYAEEAVRQALAELVPVGCCMATANGHLHTFSSMRAADEVGQRARNLKQTMFLLYMLPETSPGHKPAPVDTSSGHSAALQVATVAMQLIRRSALSAFDRQQHDKLVQDFAALHERNPPEPSDG
jgi:hypothetical protein